MITKMGERIKRLRKRKGISQEALAEILGVSFQAVSKWETTSTMPDISLVPSIAAFFDVSIDELFDYNVLENQQRAEEICRAAATLRKSDPARAEELLQEGLKQFPGNETMLTILLYTLLAIPGREEDIINTCNTIIEYTENDGVKYDVVRILAQTYASLGKHDAVESVLEQIPEFYFSKMECIANLLVGQKALDAAQFQMNLSARITVEMLRIMAREYEGRGEISDADSCRRIADGIVHVYQQENGQRFEIAGYEWIEHELTERKTLVFRCFGCQGFS